MLPWLATTLSLIAGGILTMLAAWISDKRLSERDRERRAEEKHDRAVIRRNDFQRETLLALQVCSQDLLRSAGASLHQDRMIYQKTGQWQRQKLTNDLSADQMRLVTSTMLYASRVRDREVRELADRLRDVAAVVALSDDETHAENRMKKACDTQAALIQRIGQIVRSLDDID